MEFTQTIHIEFSWNCVIGGIIRKGPENDNEIACDRQKE
jgi:hypothetical protein